MAATNDPLSTTRSSEVTVSEEAHTIAGILTTVHGLAEIPPSTTSISCLWLLHPRLSSKDRMSAIANSIVQTWNTKASKYHNSQAGITPQGLIAVSFDQRNHGSRLVDPIHNQAWREGNPRHAQDMFGCFHGTAVDTSHLMDYLESYIFTSPTGPHITQHMVLGISLGGHSAWHCILAEPRMTAAVVGIGCPDYTRLMADRARLSKLDSWMNASPPGTGFIGSQDFPEALQAAVAKYDPAGLLLPGFFNPVGEDPPVSQVALDQMNALIRERLQGKKILNLSGAKDKLVPYASGERFLTVFKQVLQADESLDVHLDEVIFDGVGHAFPEAMVKKSAEWICGILEAEGRGGEVNGLHGASRI